LRRDLDSRGDVCYRRVGRHLPKHDPDCHGTEDRPKAAQQPYAPSCHEGREANPF